MDLSKLKFTTKFFISNDPPDLSVTDTINYPGTSENTSELIQPAIAVTQVVGRIIAVLPSGTAFYTGDFSSPDIDRDLTDTKSGIEITLDAENEISKGVYSLTYEIKVTDEIFQLPIVNIALYAPTSKYRIYVAGDYRDVHDDATAWDIVNSDGAVNDGAYTIAQIIYDSTNNQTVFEINGTPASTTPTGEFQLTATRIYSVTNEYDYEYDIPTPKIVMSADINKSELTSDDQTDYGTYDTLVRAHTVNYPVDLSPAKSPVTGNLKTQRINPIYTNTFVTELTSTLNAVTDDGLYIEAVIEGSKSLDVEVDNTLCECYQCIANLFDNFKNAVDTNSKDVWRYQVLAQKVMQEYDLYVIARACGNNTEAQTRLTNIKSYVSDSNCSSASVSNSDKSVLVVAVSAGGVSTVYNEVVNAIYSGTSDPLSSQYSDSDWYLNLSTGEFFQKVSGAWVSKVSSIFGTNGAKLYSGSTDPLSGQYSNGDWYLNTVTGELFEKVSGSWSSRISSIIGDAGENGVTILYKNTATITKTYGPGAASAISGLSYAVPAGLFVNGDEMVVEGTFKRDQAAPSTGNIYVDFGGVNVAQIDWAALTDMARFQIKCLLQDDTNFMMNIMRSLGHSYVAGVPAPPSGGVINPASQEIYGFEWNTPGFDFSAGFTIKVYTTHPSVSQTIYATHFNVYKYTKKS